MASPPYNNNYGTSVSPSYPAHAQLPPSSRKRPSEMSGAPAGKRRKASMMSTGSALSAHPLRQTSFPPDGSDMFSPIDARSPSVDTMSLVSGSIAGAPVKKKRGRKPKGGEDTTATVGGGALTAVSGASGRGRASRGVSAEEEEDDIGGDTAVRIVARSKEEKEKENKHRAMLVAAFDATQFQRYEQWRSARLSDAIVRRIINQTLSQSVPASVILAVKSVTKIFAGEIIEAARKVQSQWLEASGESETGLPSPPASDNDELSRERRRGPLTADHLREALRRYKLERKSGGVGLMGLARQQMTNSSERFGLKAMGKKLLK